MVYAVCRHASSLRTHILTGKTGRTHQLHRHRPHRWSQQHCTWHWMTFPERCSIQPSWPSLAAGRRLRCCPVGQTRCAGVGRPLARSAPGWSAVQNCRCSTPPWMGLRVARSRRCNSARCSHGWGATRGSLRPWSDGTVGLPGSPGYVWRRSSSRPACSGPEVRDLVAEDSSGFNNTVKLLMACQCDANIEIPATGLLIYYLNN